MEILAFWLNVHHCTQSCHFDNFRCSEWWRFRQKDISHYDDVTMSLMASQITNLTIVYSTVYSGADQRKHQSSASLAFVRGIHRGPVNSPHKRPVTRKIFPFDDVIMRFCDSECNALANNTTNAKPWTVRDWTTLNHEPLTHLPLVPHICVSEVGQYCFR